MSLAVRVAIADDMAFIIDSWLSSYKHSYLAGLVSISSWSDIMAPQLRRILARPRAATLVAYHEGVAPGVADIAGWLAFERGAMLRQTRRHSGKNKPAYEEPAKQMIHYCYTKAPYRRMGVASRLIDAADLDWDGPTIATCKTRAGSTLPFSKLTFNPVISRQRTE